MTIALPLSTPESLIASLPYLLGFEPSESAVVLWLDGSRILLTQRLDLPPDPTDPSWHAVLWAHAAVHRSDRIVVVLVTERSDLGPMAPLVLDRADAEHLHVLDIAVTRDDRWTSLMCDEPRCCPAEGRPITEEVRTAVAAEFAWAGMASVGQRAQLVESLARDTAAAEAVAARIIEIDMPSSAADGMEAWRDGTIADITRVLGGPSAGQEEAVDPAVAGLVIAGLADVRVRDTVLWRASSWDADRMAPAVRRLSDFVRVAPVTHLAPVGSVYAALAWLAGDGARAGIVLERVLLEEPDYSLAQLMAGAVGAGLDPEAWRSAMRSLTEQDCRHGRLT